MVFTRKRSLVRTGKDRSRSKNRPNPLLPFAFWIPVLGTGVVLVGVL